MHKAELRKLLAAMLLGDGTIQCNLNKSYWFAFHHSMKQVEWAKWKKKEIDNFFKKKKVFKSNSFKESLPQYNKKTNKTYYSCRYRLYWSKYFRVYRNWVYRKDRTKRMAWLLNQIDSYKHLAIWFMDDGSEEYNKNVRNDGSIRFTNPRLLLHICDYTIEDAQIAQQWFIKNFNIEPRIIHTSRKQGRKPRLRFLAKDSRKLFSKISVYIKQTEFGKQKYSLCLERYC